ALSNTGSTLVGYRIEVLRGVFHLLDAAEAEERVVGRRRTQQQRRLRAGVEMLVLGHRGDADEVALLPVPALAIVDVVAATPHDEDEFLSDMPVAPGPAARWDLLHVDPFLFGRGRGVRVDVPPDDALRGQLPLLFGAAHHMIDGPAELDLVVHEL